ncbi:MAG: NAD(P)/FAD-dependent oxidoreductase [Chloroflexota bacterium]
MSQSVQKQHVAVIGAGAAGLAAAYSLSSAGKRVTLFEASPETGGLASGFADPAWDWPLDRFYHHWFQGDHDVLDLIKEIGAQDRVFFPRPITALWHNNEAHAFDSPMAALRYPGLSWMGKIRFGFAGLYLRLTRNWRPLEAATVQQWAPKWMGREAYEALWRPLLIGKFGSLYDQVNMAWFWARIYKRSPRLGYFEGGFQGFADAVAEACRSNGAELRLNTPVNQIQPTADGKIEIMHQDETQTFDAVISTISPTLMTQLCLDLPSNYLEQLASLQSIGAQTLILALRNQLMKSTYWLNLPATSPDKEKNDFPFVALVEHTNYIDRKHYGNEHIVYCGDYLPSDHPYMQMDKDEVLRTYLPALKKVNPDFDHDWIRASFLFRESYAQPVPGVNHSRHIPPLHTPIPNLLWASMSQVYPWDRGTNYAVEIGRRAAKIVIEKFGGQ